MTGSLLRRRRKKDEEWGRIIKGNNDRGTSRRLVTSELHLLTEESEASTFSTFQIRDLRLFQVLGSGFRTN